MTFVYTITQDGLSTTCHGADDLSERDRAHRIARRSLDTGTGEVTIMRQAGKGKPRVVAVLTAKDRVAAGERWG